MTMTLQALLRDEEGATMVEYGIMVALIAAISIGAIQILGTKVLKAFTTINGVMP